MPLGDKTTKTNGKAKSKAKPDHEMTKDEQAKASSELVISNAKANQEILDSEESAVLAEAIEIGHELSEHPEFEEALTQAVDYKKEDNYKSIRMLGLLEQYLSPDKLARLPWPGSTKADAELDALRIPANKRPNILVYDKVKGAGKGAQSYYRALVLATQAGRKAYDDKNERISAISGDKKTSPDVEDDTLAINQMLSAIKTAAKIRIQLDKIKKLKNIQFQWIREDEETPLPDECDATMSYIEDASPVRKSTKVLWFKNKDATTADPQRVSVGTFLRWKISDEMMDRGQATITGDKGLMESPNKVLERDPNTGKTKLVKPAAAPRPATVPTARDVHSWTELVTNMDAMVTYVRGINDAEHQLRFTEWKGSFIASPDETLWSAFTLKTYLDSVFADTSLVEKARAYDRKSKAA